MESSVEVDESEAIPVQMAAGEALAFHNWMLHKSEANRSQDRDRQVLFPKLGRCRRSGSVQ